MEFLLQFTPEQVCMSCGELTSTGIADTGHNERSLYLEPYCPRHGYMGTVPNPPVRQVEEEAYTIKRFVLSQQEGGQGEVTSVVSVPLDELEAHGIDVFRGEKHWLADTAWRVEYQRDGVQQSFYVIWSDQYMQFDDLYPIDEA